jgi:hypothetical protein
MWAVEEEPGQGAGLRAVTEGPRRRKSTLAVRLGGGLALALVLVLVFGFVLRSKTKPGTLVVEVDQPAVEVYVDGARYGVSSPDEKEPIQIEVPEGTRRLKVVKDGFETFTREFTVESGGKETVRVRLQHEKPPPRPEKANGLALSEVVDCAPKAFQLGQPGQEFDIAKPWLLSFEFQVPDYNPGQRFLFFWGDDRGGCDPLYVEQNGTNMFVIVTDCHTNVLGGLGPVSLQSYPPHTWVSLTVCYRTDPKVLELYLDGKLVRREALNITPSVDRPMPLWLGQGVGNPGVRFPGKINHFWLGNLK